MKISDKRQRVRNRLKFLTKRPRLSVHKTNKYIYVQLIEQFTGKVIVSGNTRDLMKKDKTFAKKKPLELASALGKRVGKEIIGKKIKNIVFDRSGYKYHGKIKALAEGLREAGLNF